MVRSSACCKCPIGTHDCPVQHCARYSLNPSHYSRPGWPLHDLWQHVVSKPHLQAYLSSSRQHSRLNLAAPLLLPSTTRTSQAILLCACVVLPRYQDPLHLSCLGLSIPLFVCSYSAERFLSTSQDSTEGSPARLQELCCACKACQPGLTR